MCNLTWYREYSLKVDTITMVNLKPGLGQLRTGEFGDALRQKSFMVVPDYSCLGWFP